MVAYILGSKYVTVSVSGRFSFIKWETQNNIGLNILYKGLFSHLK